VRPLVERKIRFLFRDDAKFPRQVAEMPEAIRPDWLFVAGNLELLDRPSLAIVGTRDPSPNGEFLSRYAVSCAQMLDAPVVSGLAQGIDRIVHEWCLQVSLPTVSILAWDDGPGDGEQTLSRIVCRWPPHDRQGLAPRRPGDGRGDGERTATVVSPVDRRLQ
jgi:DNA recombination-mediator protein A